MLYNIIHIISSLYFYKGDCMIENDKIKKILKLRYIDNCSYIQIEATFNAEAETQSNNKIKVSRQSIAKICKFYYDFRQEFRKAYNRNQVDKFLEKHPRSRDGSGNKVLNEADIFYIQCFMNRMKEYKRNGEKALPLNELIVKLQNYLNDTAVDEKVRSTDRRMRRLIDKHIPEVIAEAIDETDDDLLAAKIAEEKLGEIIGKHLEEKKYSYATLRRYLIEHYRDYFSNLRGVNKNP